MNNGENKGNRGKLEESNGEEMGKERVEYWGKIWGRAGCRGEVIFPPHVLQLWGKVGRRREIGLE